MATDQTAADWLQLKEQFSAASAKYERFACDLLHGSCPEDQKRFDRLDGFPPRVRYSLFRYGDAAWRYAIFHGSQAAFDRFEILAAEGGRKVLSAELSTDVRDLSEFERWACFVFDTAAPPKRTIHPTLAMTVPFRTGDTGYWFAELDDIFLASALACNKLAEWPEYPTAPVADPPERLIGWPRILEVLKQPNSNQRLIARFNVEFGGPIMTKQGAKPWADKSELLSWWAVLKSRWLEQRNAKRDRQATVSEAHAYGRGGSMVVPDINGEVKTRKRRKKV